MYEDIIVLSSLFFSLGVCFLFSPLPLSFIKKADIKDRDAKLFVWFAYYIFAYSISYFLISGAGKNHVYLTPFVFITVLLKIISPSSISSGISKKYTKIFLPISLFMAGYSIYGIFFGADMLPQNLIITIGLAFLFVKFYIKTVMRMITPGEYVIQWVAGIMIGISFFILLPGLYPGFIDIYRFAGAFGWSAGTVYSFRKTSVKDG